jgi:hypothetical protein
MINIQEKIYNLAHNKIDPVFTIEYNFIDKFHYLFAIIRSRIIE